LPESPRRISFATAFFALLALALAIALYVKTRPSEPERLPERRAASRHAARPQPHALPSTPTRPPEPLARSAEGRIAIVIDDLGNDREALERIARWPFAVAGAVLPELPGSADAARRLAASGKEVLLHLPMEPDGYPQVRPGPGVVLRSDSDEKIAQTVVGDLATVPGAVGVNNHMGSAATADPRVMRAVVRVLAERGLFLVDSRTTEATVARQVADEAALPVVSRRVFLDAVPTASAVERSFAELIRNAKKDRTALAIGHPNPATLALLERELPRLRERGIKLVHVKELLSQGPKGFGGPQGPPLR
jgi:hypothetical protein